MFPSIQYVADPLNPGQSIPQFDRRFGGASQFWVQKAQYARMDAARLNYWKSPRDPNNMNPTPDSNPQPGDRCFADWQANAMRDQNDLRMPEAQIRSILGDPPQPPLSHVVSVAAQNDGTYVVSIVNGPPVTDPATGLPAALPSPLIPGDPGKPGNSFLPPPSATNPTVTQQLAAQQQQIDLLTKLLQALLAKSGVAAMVLLICSVAMSAQVFAQAPLPPPVTAGAVILRMIPEPMAVPAAVLANARDMGRWTVLIKNNTAAPVTVYAEDILIASGNIAFITPDDALLVLNGHVQRSTAQKLVTGLMYAGKGAAIGMAIASRANFGWSVGIGIGTSLLPDVIAIAQGAVPSAVPLLSTVKWPVVLAPGQPVLDHWFAAKMKNPKPVTAVIGQ